MKNHQITELTLWTSSQILGHEMHAPYFHNAFKLLRASKFGHKRVGLSGALRAQHGTAAGAASKGGGNMKDD